MRSPQKFLPDKSMRALRRILGQTQERFAAFLGVSTPWIKAIECGQHPLSEKLARRIMIAAGAVLGRWTVSRDRRGKTRTRFNPFRDGRIESVWPAQPGAPIDRRQEKPGDEGPFLEAHGAIGPVAMKPIRRKDLIVSRTGSQAGKSKKRSGIAGRRNILLSTNMKSFSVVGGPARTGSTLPYDKRLFKHHLRVFNSLGSAEQRFETLAPKLKSLFIAAAKPGRAAKHRLPALEMSLLDWMAEANREFKLGIDLEE
jgi:transcriptional regulator with XRE-family HTH domain